MYKESSIIKKNNRLQFHIRGDNILTLVIQFIKQFKNCLYLFLNKIIIKSKYSSLIEFFFFIL